jgi:hypothetical protein
MTGFHTREAAKNLKRDYIRHTRNGSYQQREHQGGSETRTNPVIGSVRDISHCKYDA